MLPILDMLGWNKKSAYEAALQASKATAYYCETEGFITPERLKNIHPLLSFFLNNLKRL